MANTYLPEDLLQSAEDMRVRRKGQQLVDDLMQRWTPPPPAPAPQEPTGFGEELKRRMLAPFQGSAASPAPADAAATPEPAGFGEELKQRLLAPFQSQASPYSGALTTLGGTPEAEALTQPGGTAYTGDAPSGEMRYGAIDHSSRDAFVRSMAPYAVEAEKATGIPAAIMLAINLNEQGWQHPAPGNNYFGIKGSNPRTGANTGPVSTWENYGNGRVNIQDTFRAYGSPAESYADFAQFLKDNPRYQGALQILQRTGDPAAFIKAVHQAGYATDPAWSDKILSIAQGVAPYVGQAQQTVAQPQPAAPSAPMGTIKGGISVSDALAADRGRSAQYALEPASDPANVTALGDEPLSGAAPSPMAGPSVPYGVADNVEPGDFSIPGRPLEPAQTAPSPQPSDAVEPASSAPASLGDRIRSTFEEFGSKLGDLLGGANTAAVGGLNQGARTVSDVWQKGAENPSLSRRIVDATVVPMAQDIVGGLNESRIGYQNALSDVTGGLIPEGSSERDANGYRVARPQAIQFAENWMAPTSAVPEVRGLADTSEEALRRLRRGSPDVLPAPAMGIVGQADDAGRRMASGGDAMQPKIIKYTDDFFDATDHDPDVPRAGIPFASPVIPEDISVSQLRGVIRSRKANVPESVDLYHLTPSDKIETITQNGLRPGGDTHGGEFFDYWNGNVRTPRPKDVIYAADNAGPLANVGRDAYDVDGWALLRFKAGQRPWRADPETNPEYVGAWISRQPVKPEEIEIWTGQEWRPLVERPPDAARQYDRYYHGTGSDFALPETGKFDPNGLFGPGYYVTSDARVAGSGDLTRAGYAEERGASAAKGGTSVVWQQWADRETDPIKKASLQEKADAARAKELVGPNIRPVDVPRDLKLLDADALPPDGIVGRIQSVLPDAERKEFDRYLTVSRPDPDLPQLWRGVINPDASMQSIYDAIPGSRARANAVLQSLGYDGIRYAGGKRIPMTDEAGKAIEHQAVVIFPESLDKIRNATAGTPGGLLPGTTPQLGTATRIGGQALGSGVGAAYQEIQREGSTPESIAQAGLGAAVTSLGNAAISRAVGPRGAQGVMRAVGAARQNSTSLPIELTDREEAARINVEKLAGPGVAQDIKDFIVENARNAGWFHAQRRGVRPDEVVNAEAQALNQARSVDQWIQGGKAGKAYTDTETVAIRNAYLTQASIVDDLEKQLTGPLTRDQRDIVTAQYLLEQQRMRGLAEVAEGARAEAGRTLRQYNQFAQILKADPAAGAKRYIEKTFGSIENADAVIDEFMSMKVAGATPQELAGYLRNVGATSALERWQNRAQIFRYANMLSGTVTHLINLGSALATQGVEVALKPLAVGIDVTRVGAARVLGQDAQREIFLREIGPQLQGMAGGFLDGLRQIPEILRTGVTLDDATKLDRVRAGVGANIPVVGKAPVPVLGTVNEAVNFAVEAPLRALSAEDTLTRSMARGGHVMELATRQAIKEGARDVQARVAEIIADPGKYWKLFEQADEMATRNVFQENRPVSDWLMKGKALQGLPGAMVNMALPFVKTPINVAAQGVAMTPAGFLSALKSARAGNVAEAEMQAAKAMFGTGLLGTAFALGSNGLLTAGTPEDDAERSTLPQGWKPWSFRMPQADGTVVYVNYANLGPMGVPLAVGAIIADAQRRGEDVSQWAPKTAIQVGQYLGDQTFLQGLSDFARAFRQPQQFGENFVEGLATQWMPYAAMQRQIQQATGMAQRDPKGAVEALLATSPITAGMVPERQDRLGRTVYPTQTGVGAVITPARYGVEQPDALLAALRRAGVGIGNPPTKISSGNGQEIVLSRSDQSQYRKAMGRELQMHLTELNDPDPTTRQRTVERVMAQARDVARRELLSTRP